MQALVLGFVFVLCLEEDVFFFCIVQRISGLFELRFSVVHMYTEIPFKLTGASYLSLGFSKSKHTLTDWVVTATAYHMCIVCSGSAA